MDTLVNWDKRRALSWSRSPAHRDRQRSEKRQAVHIPLPVAEKAVQAGLRKIEQERIRERAHGREGPPR